VGVRHLASRYYLVIGVGHATHVLGLIALLPAPSLVPPAPIPAFHLPARALHADPNNVHMVDGTMAHPIQHSALVVFAIVLLPAIAQSGKRPPALLISVSHSFVWLRILRI